MGIYSILPDAEALLALEPEELAGIVLHYLNTLQEGQTELNRYNFGLPSVLEEYPSQYRGAVGKALMEAWMWLEREGFIAPKPGIDGHWAFVTRRGKRILNPSDLEKYRKGDMLPKRLLHPIIAQKVWSMFLRGEYDTAVFQAFKEVEIAVRETGGFLDSDLGVELMRKAFHPLPSPGSLTDTTTLTSEQEALSHLFAGAIGSYKNPHSHRNVSIEPEEAVEMIVLASHLLRIVDSRRVNHSI